MFRHHSVMTAESQSGVLSTLRAKVCAWGKLLCIQVLGANHQQMKMWRWALKQLTITIRRNTSPNWVNIQSVQGTWHHQTSLVLEFSDSSPTTEVRKAYHWHFEKLKRNPRRTKKLKPGKKLKQELTATIRPDNILNTLNLERDKQETKIGRHDNLNGGNPIAAFICSQSVGSRVSAVVPWLLLNFAHMIVWP